MSFDIIILLYHKNMNCSFFTAETKNDLKVICSAVLIALNMIVGKVE